MPMKNFTIALAFLAVGCPKTPDDEDAPEKVVEAPEAVPTPDDPEPQGNYAFEFRAADAHLTNPGDEGRRRLWLRQAVDHATSPDDEHQLDNQTFVERFPFDDASPSLAELRHGAGMAKSTMLRVWHPVWSAGAKSLMFEVEVVGGDPVPRSLDEVGLRVQDCPDQDYRCAKFTLEACQAATGKIGTCWNWLALDCLPCHCSEAMDLCKEHDPKCCGDPDAPCYPAKLGPHGWERFCL